MPEFTLDHVVIAVKDLDGATQDYTHIRWLLKQSVAPGQSGSVRFRALIL